MIIIQQNQLNEIAVTLFEKEEVPVTDTFLFEFISNTSQESFFCVAQDLSTTERYNIFCITELSGSTNPLSGQTSLPLKGQYTYKIYQNPLSSLSPVGLNLCEVGRLLVTGIESTPPVYSNPQTLTFYQKS